MVGGRPPCRPVPAKVRLRGPGPGAPTHFSRFGGFREHGGSSGPIRRGKADGRMALLWGPCLRGSTTGTCPLRFTACKVLLKCRRPGPSTRPGEHLRDLVPEAFHVRNRGWADALAGEGRVCAGGTVPLQGAGHWGTFGLLGNPVTRGVVAGRGIRSPMRHACSVRVTRPFRRWRALSAPGDAALGWCAHLSSWTSRSRGGGAKPSSTMKGWWGRSVSGFGRP